MTAARHLLWIALLGGCGSQRPPRSTPAPEREAPASVVAADGTCRVRGRVVDEGGEPVAQAQVSDLWTHEGGRVLQPFDPVQADGAGRFDGTFDVPPGTELCLAAYSLDRRLAGIASFAPSAPPTDPNGLVIVVQPTQRVRGSLASSDQTVPKWTNVNWFPVSPVASRSAVVQAALRDPFFDVPLPRGDWRWLALGKGLDTRSGEIELAAAGADVDLGVIEVPSSTFARLCGQKLPEWKVTDCRGLAKERSALSTFRGRWLLVAFWGTWCDPCVGETIPRLVAFCDQHKDLRPKFEVVVFHDASVRNFEEFDSGVSVAKGRAWNARELPFPVFLDSNGETLRTFGICSFPTTILIDPEGRLVGEADEEVLLQRLAGTPSADSSVATARTQEKQQ